MTNTIYTEIHSRSFKIIFMNCHVLLFLLLGCCFLTSCEKHEEAINYHQPIITLSNCNVTSSNTFDVAIYLFKGESFNLNSLQLSLYDMASTDAQPHVVEVDIPQEDRSTFIQTVTVPQAGHDYLVYATLKTDRNTFVSDPVSAVLTQYNWNEGLDFYLGNPVFVPQGEQFCNGDIGICLMPGDSFAISIDDEAHGMPVSIKIGDIPLTAAWTEYYRTDGYSDISVQLPSNFAAGIYDVTVCLEMGNIRMKQKMEVLPWKYSLQYISDHNFPLNSYTSFQIGNLMYYLGINNNEGTSCLSYNISSGTTEHKTAGPPYIDKAISCNNHGYAITTSGQLLKYDPSADRWSDLGQTPMHPDASGYMFFGIGLNLYFGGGAVLSFEKEDIDWYKDFWRYDTNTDKWTQIEDLPFGFVHPIASCSGSDCAYVLIAKGEFWRFDGGSESWSKETRLDYEYYLGSSYASMIEYNDKIIMVGNEYNKSVNVYDPTTHAWNLNCYYNVPFYRNFSYTPAIFVDDDLIQVGPQALYYRDEAVFLNIEMK